MAGPHLNASVPRVRRIVVFNDSVDTLTTIAKWLEIHGHRVTTAQLPEMRNAASEAENLIIRQQADTVVFDVGLPYLPNYDFYEVLQAFPALAAVRFVLTTSNKEALDRQVGQRTNAIEIVGRPEDLGRLLHAIQGGDSHRLPASGGN